MSLDLTTCYNKGCQQKFSLDENSDTSCVYHPGGPIFHDALKGWSCCKKRVSDFTEFLNIKGCTIGKHNDVKPPEPVKPGKSEITHQMIQVSSTPSHKAPKKTHLERPPPDEPFVDLKTTVGASLRTQLEKLKIDDQSEDVDGAADGTSIKIGTSCHNKGCKASYEGESSLTDTCIYHSGVPIFHEGMKYWTCCQRKTSDFEAFLNQEGCETGKHNFVKPKVSEEKQVRIDWHQTSSIVCVSIFAKVSMPEETRVKANRTNLTVEILYEGGKSAYNKTFVLKEVIDPSRSDVKLLGTKVEINLKKVDAFSWSTLELPQTTPAESPAK